MLTNVTALGLIKTNVPLRVVRTGMNEVVCAFVHSPAWLIFLNQNEIRKFDAFPSLRIIEIDCKTQVNESDVARLVEVAKQTLRACADYKPPAKTKKSRKATSNTGNSLDDLVDLYPEPRAVRLRHYHCHSKNGYGGAATYLTPPRVEEHRL